LAIRDVYDLERPQVVLAVPPRPLRVWSTELNVQSTGNGRTRVLRPAYLSVQISDAAPARVGLPNTLHHTDIPPHGVSVYTDLGIVLLHDDVAITPADMESLDQSWEQAWESPSDYSEVLSGSGATVISCKTTSERTQVAILASVDAGDRPVAIHIDFGLGDVVGEPGRRAPRTLPRWLRRRR